MTTIQFIGVNVLGCALLLGQDTTKENAARMAAGNQPIFRASVTARTAKAINYRHRSGATKIDFRGTDLLPGSRGEAKVESKQGYIEIEVEFDDLQPATRNGAEYLTYVMWAITPEGRTANLGEVLLNGTKSKLNVTTELQVFALVVTAEPYFAVTRPSDLVVMENVIRKDTVGKIEEVDAKYELLERGQYQRLSNPLALKADKKIPLELYEARNAVSIARSIGAESFATETLAKAEKTLVAAEAYQARNAGRKPVTMTAREAVQTAEDARAIAVKRQEEAALAAERQSSADRENRAETAKAAAQNETDRVSREAELAALKAKEDSERLSREKDAQAAASAADASRAKRDSDALLAKAALDADRAKLATDTAAAAAKAEAKRQSDAMLAQAALEAGQAKLANDTAAAAAKAEAERMQRENETQRAASQAALDAAAKQVDQLQTQKAELRSQLLAQFNAVLQTQDTARGLIVNMTDVLFDTAKHTLRPLAREKLAKVAGIVSGHTGLRLDVEGHTDSVGTDEYNQVLSQERGSSVRDYLVQQGMPAASVTTKGMGENQPIATNDTPEGRQQNRRVELVISGEVIGRQVGVPNSGQ
jgi:outer membrane protein OmpA-like peptidoglycan-associated protein